MTNQQTVLEATINAKGSELLDLISSWNTAARGAELGTGTAVDEAMSQAFNLRRRVEDGSPVKVDLSDQGQAADILHALCRSLMDDCAGSPRSVLEVASSVQDVLAASPWVEDELEEREELLCSLAFTAWRAARLLGFSREAQRWESLYRRMFLHSLQWKVAESLWLSKTPGDIAAEDTLAQGPEALFQALLYFESEGEAAPQNIMKSATALYCSLRLKKHALAPDFHSYFLGESARIVAGMLRMIGQLQKSEEWLKLAEAHFRDGANARPHLARVTFGRLALLNVLSRCKEVCQAAPELDQTFAELGMEEDRVKGRIHRGIGTGTDVDFRDSACALRLGPLAIGRYPTDLRKLRTRAHGPNARCTTPSSGKAIHRARRCQRNSLRVVSSSWEVARGP